MSEDEGGWYQPWSGLTGETCRLETSLDDSKSNNVFGRAVGGITSLQCRQMRDWAANEDPVAASTYLYPY